MLQDHISFHPLVIGDCKATLRPQEVLSTKELLIGSLIKKANHKNSNIDSFPLEFDILIDEIMIKRDFDQDRDGKLTNGLLLVNG